MRLSPFLLPVQGRQKVYEQILVFKQRFQNKKIEQIFCVILAQVYKYLWAKDLLSLALKSVRGLGWWHVLA